MKDNFDLKGYLAENKMTTNSRGDVRHHLTEAVDLDMRLFRGKKLLNEGGYTMDHHDPEYDPDYLSGPGADQVDAALDAQRDASLDAPLDRQTFLNLCREKGYEIDDPRRAILWATMRDRVDGPDREALDAKFGVNDDNVDQFLSRQSELDECGDMSLEGCLNEGEVPQNWTPVSIGDGESTQYAAPESPEEINSKYSPEEYTAVPYTAEVDSWLDDGVPEGTRSIVISIENEIEAERSSQYMECTDRKALGDAIRACKSYEEVDSSPIWEDESIWTPVNGDDEDYDWIDEGSSLNMVDILKEKKRGIPQDGPVDSDDDEDEEGGAAQPAAVIPDGEMDAAAETKWRQTLAGKDQALASSLEFLVDLDKFFAANPTYNVRILQRGVKSAYDEIKSFGYPQLYVFPKTVGYGSAKRLSRCGYDVRNSDGVAWVPSEPIICIHRPDSVSPYGDYID